MWPVPGTPPPSAYRQSRPKVGGSPKCFVPHRTDGSAHRAAPCPGGATTQSGAAQGALGVELMGLHCSLDNVDLCGFSKTCRGVCVVGWPIVYFAGCLDVFFLLAWVGFYYLFFLFTLFFVRTFFLCRGACACPPTPPRTCRERSPPEGFTGARQSDRTASRGGRAPPAFHFVRASFGPAGNGGEWQGAAGPEARGRIRINYRVPPYDLVVPSL